MGMRSPPPLYELAKQSLLRNETIASTDFHNLPIHIFHDLFVDAFMGDHNESLKVMVQAWPFPYFPLKSLMNMRSLKTSHFVCGNMPQHSNLRTLKALLDALDIQLSQEVRHSRWKLQVLDWRDGHEDFWIGGPRAMNAVHLADAKSKDASKPGLSENQPTLRIFTHLCFEPWASSFSVYDQLQLCLLKWARKRKASVHLYSEKVTIKSSEVFKILKLLQTVQLDSIQELNILCDWGQKGMKAFVRLLKKMKNLRTIHFSRLSAERLTAFVENKLYSCLHPFHIGDLPSLRELHLDEVFLHGTLHEILRSQTPLEVLSLRSSPLKECDLQHLSQGTSTSQLRSLTLRGISMKSFNPEILQILIDKLASTLETLDLEHCDLTDFQLLVILPALSHCSQLKSFSCYGNHFSLGVLQVLLNLSARLSHLTLGMYPAPLESYESNIPAEFVHPEQFAQVCIELEEVLMALRPSLRVKICAYSCDLCMLCQFYRLDPNGYWEITE
ncbi:PRAME family member 12-like, partial [Octodon degus]|uniref:PRAME family member 12-like n=1 Tax=Octodon degus TaxID=10160 RepID=A0A6P3FZC9_OCTDE